MRESGRTDTIGARHQMAICHSTGLLFALACKARRKARGQLDFQRPSDHLGSPHSHFLRGYSFYRLGGEVTASVPLFVYRGFTEKSRSATETDCFSSVVSFSRYSRSRQ